MADTGARTLRLLSLLQSRRHWSGPDLAGRLGVSARTLRRDVDRLRGLGYPVEANRGAEGGYQLAAGASLPPLVLDDEEAVALVVGMQAAAHDGTPGIGEASLRALTKVVQVMPPHLRRRAETLLSATVAGSWSPAYRPAAGRSEAQPGVDADVLVVVAQACRDGERLTFGYTSRSGAATVRHVEPHRLVSMGRRWYLVAYDLDRHDWRCFRLDRFDPGRDVRRTSARFAPRPLPAADAAEFVRASVREVPHREVEAVVEAPADDVRARLGASATVEPIGAATCRLRMTPDSLDWALFALGVCGAPFRIVRPPDLAARAAEWGGRFQQAGLRAGHGS